MRKWQLWVLAVSVFLNIYFIGKDFWVSSYTPNQEDQALLGEMVPLVISSEDYRELAEKEKVYAITTHVNRNKGGIYPFHYGVIVKTDQESHVFACKDGTCAEMENTGSMYSDYSEEAPMLPLK